MKSVRTEWCHVGLFREFVGTGGLSNSRSVEYGRIRLSVSTASRTYELSEETHVTPFRLYRFHSTVLCDYTL